MSHGRISFGLVVRNEEHHICELLTQLKGLSESEFHEVVVVDNASTDSTVSLIEQWRQHHPTFSLRVMVRDKNHMAQARNQVLESAQGDWVYFVDADCRLQVTSIGELTEKIIFYAKDSTVAALGGGNVVGGKEHWLERRLIEMTQVWLGHMGSIQIVSPRKLQSVSLLSTCNMLVHRQKALSVGGFDNDFAKVGEDMSLCHRLRKEDFKLLAIPGLDVIHLQRMSVSHWCRKMFSYGEAQVLVASKYGSHFLSLRGLQFIMVWLAFLSIFLNPELLVGIVLSYLMVLLVMSVISLKEIKSTFTSAGFIFLSQTFYAIGELFGTFTSLRLLLLSHLPNKIAALEQK